MQSQPPLKLEPHEARSFHRRATLLGAAPSAALGDVVSQLGYVQLDPLNVCGRMHDLILRNRVADYRAGDLLRWLHGCGDEILTQPVKPEKRGGFEFYLPGGGILVAFSWEAWPYLHAAMRERRVRARDYHGMLSPAEEEFARRIIGELGERGALSTDDFVDEEQGTTAWGTRAKMVKIVLEKIFAHGRVLISQRRNFRRIYDLPERIVPASVAKLPEAAPSEVERWLLCLHLRQHRLAGLKPAEAERVADLAQPIAIEGVKRLHALRSDVSNIVLQKPARGSAENAGDPLLLAPLDPLIYDRTVTRSLWGFDYSWEVYTPAPKRVRGYYALPVLSGDSFVGHVEPRFDYKKRKMTVLSKSLRRGNSVVCALKSLAGCLSGEAGRA